MRQALEGVAIRGGRRLRVGLSVLVGAAALFILLSALVLRMHREPSPGWIEFSIGPASGESAAIQSSAMRADGITLIGALAVAYNVPAVRIIGPPWLSETRYSINAVVGLDTSDSFHSLLQEELKNRLRLETHVEVRPFDVFVLTATGAPRLERAQRTHVRTWIGKREVQLQNASLERLAAALQNILGMPVIDETGITGSYDLEFAWGEDRVASVTATIHDRFGLRLSPDRREMEALIVDRIRRDAALVLLAQIGRVTGAAPPALRKGIADILTIR